MSTKDISLTNFNLGDEMLRQIYADDIDKVFAALSNPRVIAHYGVSYKSIAATNEQMLWYEKIVAEKTGIWWGIATRQSNELIGACGFNDWSPDHKKTDLGYWLLPEFWGQGIMYRALRPVLAYAFNHMNVHRVHADVEPENLASVNLLRKLGFFHEGTLRDVECKDGKYVSLHQFSLIETDPSALTLNQ